MNLKHVAKKANSKPLIASRSSAYSDLCIEDQDRVKRIFHL